MENGMEFPLKLKKKVLPHDSAILFLDIYMEKIIISKVTCTPVFIAALFTIASIQKKAKCQHMSPEMNE